MLSLLLAFRASAAEVVLDFGAVGRDESPAGFTNVLVGSGRPGRWRAVHDDLPGVTNQIVLAQTSVDVKDERFPVLIYTKQEFDDFTLTTKFKIVDGVTEQMAGVVFRYQDEKSFYVVRASALGSNVRFYKVVGGIRGQPIGPSLPIEKGVWYELKVACNKNKIRIALNGVDIIPELTDTSFAKGKVGFWTKSDSLSRFAETRIEYIQREPFAQVIVNDALKEYNQLLGLKIYLADEQGVPRVVASKEPQDLGTEGGKSEQGALTKGQIFYGKEKTVTSVVQPLRDRNGEPIAAVRVMMKPYPGQTEQAVLQRALPVVRSLQARVQSLEDLR
ncbi:MAG: DUF1080 domain-containing protein [Verrucomicrobiota bacterium]